MDTPNLILKRAEIQRRMEARRLGAVEARNENPVRILPWALKTGIGLMSGARTASGTYGWLGSVAGAVVLPTLLTWLGHKPKNDKPRGLLYKLASLALPFLKS